MLFSVALLLAPVLASSKDVGVFISEIIEGSSYNRAIEVYNPLEESVNLKDYVVGHSLGGNCSKSLGSEAPTDIGPCDPATFSLPVSYLYLNTAIEDTMLQPGQTVAICNPRAIDGGPHGGGGGNRGGKEGEGWVIGGGGGGGGGTGMGHPDALVSGESCSSHSHAVAFDGDDSIILARVSRANGGMMDGSVIGATAIDIVGDMAGVSSSVCGVEGAMTDNTLVRKPTVTTGNSGNWTRSSGTSAVDCEWTVEPQDTVLKLLSHVCVLPKNPYVPPVETESAANGTDPDAAGNASISAGSSRCATCIPGIALAAAIAAGLFL